MNCHSGMKSFLSQIDQGIEGTDSTTGCIGNITPIERKTCRFLKLMNLVLKAQLSSLLRHLFRVRGFLISPPSPLPPHLNPPPPRGEEVIFLTQLGFHSELTERVIGIVLEGDDLLRLQNMSDRPIASLLVLHNL